ncbi:MAG TPA: polysaccharide pyruvyl transferase family protein [Candidatus Acidoferrales bacterium]|nr:polysaccharide pyruvyl transferase family protein [Candidatus Acidoferrales bacterium]
MAGFSEQSDSGDCRAGTRMTDFILVAWVSALIGMARVKWMLGRGQRWKRGEKLRLLFAGYNGTRNTGSDVRVNEMLHQIRHVLGAENVDFSVMTQDFGRTKGYFDGTHQVHLPDVFPPMLYREVGKSQGVIACEGSMFKSKFANALTTMMIGSLGLASAENKLSVGYGGEAGHMDPLIRNMCARYVSESLVITRNTESQSLLHSLGIQAELGTDTAWTFKPHPQEYAQKVLREAGWDGKTPILVICPIHPFVWPVKASIAKYAARVTTGAYKASQYRTVYFHESGREVDRKFQRYVSGITNATKAFLQRHQVFPILVAMERLDAVACREIAAQISGTPIFTSDDYDMFQMVSILRACTFMVSSRYHGIVTCMPSLVASAGVTMDERIRNLMRERGHEHLFLTVDDPELEPKLLKIMETLVRERDAVREGIGCTVVRNLKMMARMGVLLEDAVRRQYPEFPLRSGVLSWEDYVPPLDENLLQLAERYDASAAVLVANN